MEHNGHRPADDRRSATTSPTPVQPRTRQGTPTDNELARALLSLSVTSQLSTPLTNRPPSNHLPGSYPETPAPPRHVITSTPIDEDIFHTPIHEPPPLQSLHYP